jgi:hypothetical protein
MSSRALSLATVLLLIGLLAAGRAQAQENLDAGKTPSQIFAGTCNACHKSPRGLLKTVSPSSLPSFLRQHYTTSPNMAGVLSSYLVSNGATDTRLPSAKEAKPAAKQEAKQEPRPNGPPEQLDRWGRRLHPNAPPPPQEAAAPAAPAAEPKPEAEPAQAVTDRGPDGRKNAAKQKLTKRGKPGEELPKEEPAASEAPKEAPKSESAAREEGRPEANRPETVKPADDGRSQSAKTEQPADTSAVRPDPVPPVTPAPSTTATATAPPAPAPAQAAVALPPTEMAVPLPATAAPPPQAPAVTASTAPPLSPVAPAGPPAPPISQ